MRATDVVRPLIAVDANAFHQRHGGTCELHALRVEAGREDLPVERSENQVAAIDEVGLYAFRHDPALAGRESHGLDPHGVCPVGEDRYVGPRVHLEVTVRPLPLPPFGHGLDGPALNRHTRDVAAEARVVEEAVPPPTRTTNCRVRERPHDTAPERCDLHLSVRDERHLGSVGRDGGGTTLLGTRDRCRGELAQPTHRQA